MPATEARTAVSSSLPQTLVRAIRWVLAPILGALAVSLLLPAGIHGEPVVPVRPATILHRMEIGPGLPVNGEFRVSVERTGKWVRAGQSKHTTRPSTGTVPLADLTLGAPVRVRISTHGPAGAQLDAVLLDGQAPTAAKGIKLGKLAKADLDVANTHGRRIELTFAPIAGTTATLTLHGRIEPAHPPKKPLRFPADNRWHAKGRNWQSYSYRLGDSPGTLAIDGRLGGEKLGKPLFTDRQAVDPGHPQGTTYGWVRDDGKTLYAAIDFTPDNTYDGDADWFAVYAKVEGKWREFKLSVPDARWGKAGFSYTGTVAYQHKVYEFAIPFEELGLQGAERGMPLQLAFAGYGTVADPQSTLALAYNSVHNQYLLVYGEETGAPAPVRIRGLRLDHDGNAIDPAFDIRATSVDHDSPEVAFDPGTGNFFVVWVEDVAGTGEIWGALIAADETVSVAAFTIDGNTRFNPRVANNPIDGNFFVVWDDGDNITGQIVEAATGDLGAPITVTDESTGGQTLPRLAFDIESERYLVAWFDSRTDQTDASNVFGQLVNADGTLYGTTSSVNFAIANTGSPQTFPGVAAIEGQFLVTWSETGSDVDIRGRRVNSDGVLQGTGEIEIFTGSGDQLIPVVSGDPVADRYAVAWKDGVVSGNEIDATTVSSAGIPGVVVTPIDENPDVADFPDVAANPYCANALVTALNNNTVTYRVGTIGTCSPAYNLLSFTPGSTTGVFSGGTATAPTTFRVTWWGAELPATAQLWIDLDMDGTAGATHGTGWPTVPYEGSLGAALAALAMLLWAARSRRRLIPAGALALSLLAVALVACGGGGGGGGGGGDGDGDTLPTCTNVSECFTMTEVSAGDTDPVDGKEYEVTITIADGADYAFSYVFTDGTTAAIGLPATGGTVTIDSP